MKVPQHQFKPVFLDQGFEFTHKKHLVIIQYKTKDQDDNEGGQMEHFGRGIEHDQYRDQEDELYLSVDPLQQPNQGITYNTGKYNGTCNVQTDI